MNPERLTAAGRLTCVCVRVPLRSESFDFSHHCQKVAEAQVLGKQLLRSGTSMGAHYHEATRDRSNAEFISKLQGGLQELEETIYWLIF
jgi:four helix bundle protein